MSKTVADLFDEYYSKKPCERINSCFSNYIFDYQQAKIDLAIVELQKLKGGNNQIQMWAEQIEELLK